MKRIFIVLGMFLVAGAGCQKANVEVVDVVVDDVNQSVTEWFIGAEDTQWYAYEAYDGLGMDFGIAKERSTDRDKAQAFVQNVDKPILLPERPIKDDVDYYQGNDWVLMDTLVYPSQARMPSDLEMLDIEGREVGVRRGNAFDAWYWKTDDKLYEIFFYTAEGSGITPEEVFATLIQQ